MQQASADTAVSQFVCFLQLTELFEVQKLIPVSDDTVCKILGYILILT